MSLFSIVQGRKAEQIPAPPPGPPQAMALPQGPPQMPFPGAPSMGGQPMPPTAGPQMGGQPGGGLTIAGKPIAGFEAGGLQELPSYEYAPRPTQPSQSDGDPNEFPPDMPVYEYADRPESDYQGVSIPGYTGGTWDVASWGQQLPGSNGGGGGLTDPGTRGKSEPTTGNDGGTLSPQAAAIIHGKAIEYQLKGYTPQQAVAAAQADWELYNLDQQNALALRGTSTQGPDHFYETQAEQIRQWEATRQDTQRLADVQQQAVQQKAVNDWKQAQLTADARRQERISGVQNNNTNAFMNNLGYLSASNGPTVQVDWGTMMRNAIAGYGPNPDPNASDANTPNIPGYVFNNPNGG